MKTKIFVTVGSTYPFDRLIKEMDIIGKNKKYEIFAQIGESNYIPKNIAFEKILSYDKAQEKIKWADLVISHAGVGSIIDILAANKKLILFPRLKEHGEAVDNHQLEICQALQKKYKITIIFKNKDLSKCLQDNYSKPRKTNKKSLVNEIKKLII